MYEGIDRIPQDRCQANDEPQEAALAKKFPGRRNPRGTYYFRKFASALPVAFVGEDGSGEGGEPLGTEEVRR